MAATSMHSDVLLDSEKCYKWKANCADANVDSLVECLEGTRSGVVAAEVSFGLGRYRRQEWRSPTNRVGNSDGDGNIKWKSKGRRSKSGGIGSGPGEGLRACRSPCGLGLGDAFQFPKIDLASAVRLFRAPDEGSVRRMCGKAATVHYGHPARVKVQLLAFALCVAGCAE